MANFENAHVKAEIERTADNYAAGLEAGYEADVNHLPSWWFNVPPARLTAWQRGFFVGREVRVEELKGQPR